MRKFILIMAFAFVGTFGFSQLLQPDQVPTDIKDRLQAVFPQTIDIPVSWSKEKGNYKAAITIMDAPAFMVIDSLGHTVRIERKLHETYLPKKAKAYLKTLDPNFEFISIYEITDNKEKVTYKTIAKIATSFTFETDGTLAGKKK
ncbi:MAG: hypothetical protein NTW16_10125 [Bacteroidetes bacterium]|nr:hypothetical protein [Bacteroidota bacterium]